MPVYKRQVNSIAKEGSTPLKGDVTVSEGSNVTITQTGQDIEIAATGGSGTPGGNDTEVQFNDGGSFAGNAGFTYVPGGGGNPHTITVGEEGNDNGALFQAADATTSDQDGAALTFRGGAGLGDGSGGNFDFQAGLGGLGGGPGEVRFGQDNGQYKFFADISSTFLSGLFDFSNITTTDKTFTLPNATGTVALTDDIPGTFDDLTDGTTNKAYTSTEKTKLAGIETAADVTDTANVTAAGALMDSEVTSLSGVKTLTVPDNTTISTAGAALVDDANAAAQLVTLGLTATAAELNTLDGITATTTELNYTDGVTSAIQTQIDGKQPLDSDLTTIAGLTATTNNIIQSVGSAWASRTPAQVKSALDLEAGTDFYSIAATDSAIDADVATHAALTSTHGATGAVVGTTNTQTLTNKTIDGDDNTLQDIKLESLKATIACRAYLANAQTTNSGAATKILLDTENFDTGSDFDTANSRFVAPVTGYYQVSGNVRFSNLTDGRVALTMIYVNGSEWSAARTYNAVTDGDPGAFICDIVFATAGQHIELYGLQDSASPESVTVGSNLTFMSIVFLGT